MLNMEKFKTRVTPEFRVIRQSEAAAKFFVASEFTSAPTPTTPSAAASLTVNTQAQTTWF